MSEGEEETPQVVDIRTRKPITRIESEGDTKPVHFLKTWSKFCKDTKVGSVLIVTIDEYNHVTWGFMSEDEHHMALACITLEDLREEIKSDLFNELELEDE